MDRETTGGSKNPKPKVLGANPLQIGEGDVSWLVGGIVEKGVSQNTPLIPPSAPRPSVLPFPVARHRSHGPHWAPKVGKSNIVNDNDDMDVGEEEDFDGVRLAAAAAVNPVQRKERKGLDFSRWKEMVKNDANTTSYKKNKESNSTRLKVGPKVNEITSNNLSRKISNPGDNVVASEMASTKEFHSFRHVSNDIVQTEQNNHTKSEESVFVEEVSTRQNGLSKEVDLKAQNMQKSYMASSLTAKKFVGREEDSLQSEIDAENSARLAKMSVDEIAEAQAEITARLNPELINALKRRAQAKVKRQKFSFSDVAVNASDSNEQDKVMFKSSETTIHDETVKPLRGDTLKDKDDKISPSASTNKGRIWDAWRERVECARDVRFSLDGDVIGSDLAHVSDTGSTSLGSGYNPNSVSTRDYLRTDGDPSAAGYTIKEAVALTRSVVPGQRTFALHVIAVILNRAICNICHSQVDSSTNSVGTEGPVDWEAIWAFALGPEPELALTLRMSLDDNHDIVVLACAKAIQCVISCDMNEYLFDIMEKTPTYVRDVCTAPVFRSKPDVNVGFLRGGFWKYNTKPSNILQFGGDPEGNKTEGEHTIQDDVVVAGQDFAAGLVRMGILPRICHLLETDPSAPLEECLISILIAIARHSPTCAAAVADFEGLVQTVASRFATKEQLEINSCKIKSVTLLKVLSRLNRKSCLAFINNGILRQVTWHLYRYPFSLDQWVKSGRKACKLSSALLVEQLRLWKVSIQYGFSISDFSDLFTALCAWLSVPTIEKLIENDVMNEYCAITKEAYLLLDVLASRLPNFYVQMHERTEDAAQDEDAWSWPHFGSIIDLALEWIDVKNIPRVSRLIDNCQHNDGENHKLQDSEVNSVLWVISSVLNMLSSLLKAVIPEDILSLPNGRLPWLPDFVPKVGLQIIKNGYFMFSGPSDTISNGHTSENGSLVQNLCHLRLNERQELAISAQCCLQGLVQVVDSVDKLIQHANLDIHTAPAKFQILSWDDKILANGILKSCKIEIQFLLSTLMKLIFNDWQRAQPIEIFGRGGPAPGVGVGWGASGGGYWSVNSLLAEQDARLLTNLLEVSEIPSSQDPFEAEEMSFAMQKLNCALTSSLLVGPGNRAVLDKLLKAIFQVPVLKYLDFGIRQFLSLKKGHNPFKWNYEEEEYSQFANVLATHFRNRWLAGKKRKATGEISRVSSKSAKKNAHSLETIHEDMDTAIMASEESSSLRSEWAYQRLPLPPHWFLSAITTIQCGKISCPPGASKKSTYIEVPSDFVEIAKGGLFFLLGIEAISTSLSSEFFSPVKHVPVVWKLHAMSVVLLTGMDVLEDAKSRDVYETLQNVYAEILDEKKFPDVHHKMILEFLKFESDIHENYSTFIEMLVEQFAAESYGDMLFGRQVAIYLHRSVEASIRLAAWNALSNAHALELLPPLHKCFAKAEGYLEPIEDDERILEAYAKSWVSGVLDKAANRGSVSFSLVLHHLSSFIFGNITAETRSLRKKLAKSLLRDFSRKQHHEGMMVKLILYEPQDAAETAAPAVAIEKRLQVLKEICDGHANDLQKLQSCCISSTR